MASIQRIKKGTYRVRVYYYDKNGKRKTISKNFKTLGEAKEYARDTEIRVKADEIDLSIPTLHDYMQQYIETFREGHVSHATLVIDNDSLKRLLKYYDPKTPLNEITGTMHQQAVNKMFKDGYAISTIKKNNSLMFRVMERARHDGFIAFNPAELIEYKITDAPKKAQYIPRDKIKPFLADVKRRNIYHYFLFRVILETGMRVGEACALTKDDIDFEDNTIRITKSYNQKSDILGNTKTKHHRKVYITDQLKEEMHSFFELHESNRNALKSDYHNNYGFIFVDQFGKPISRSSIHNTMMYCTKKVLGEDSQMSVHKLRHTYATLLLNADVPLKVIQERLGHQSMEMTEKIYAHVTPEMHKSAQIIYEESIKDVF